MQTVLFAWELGRGFGHVMNMRRTAVAVAKGDIRVVAAVRDPSAAAHFRTGVSEIVSAPPWPFQSQTPGERTAASSATLNDALSGAGLADRSAVQRLLIAWDAILERTQPDLVVADFSPLAALAARGRIPLVLIGNGYTLPPHSMPRFPLLHHLAPPVWSEEQTLSAVNHAAQSLGRPTLDRLPQLFSADACLVQAFPILDPYNTQRTEALDGPSFDAPPVAASAGAESIFAYLSSADPHPSVFEALKPHAARLRTYAPALSDRQRAELGRLGARIDEAPPLLTDVLRQSRLVVHNGGSGVASEALAAGVPQLILSTHVEQNLTGEALERSRVAKLVRMYDPNATLTPELVEAAAADPALGTCAAALGQWCRHYVRSHNAQQNLERVCLKWLGRSIGFR